VGGISSGIVIPLADQLKLSDKTKAILALESNLNNVFTVVLILALLQFSDTQAFRVFPIIAETILGFIGAVVLGGAIALLWSRLLLPIRGIQNSIFTTPAMVLIVYGLAELVGTNGIMAAFAFGIALGNLEFLRARSIPFLGYLQAFSLTTQEKNLFSGLVFLLKTYFFVYIGISMNITNVPYLLWGLAVVIAFLVLRDATVRLVLRQSLPAFDLEIVKRMIPKGLVGAALVSLVANQTVQDLTYPIILFSIVCTSALIFWAQRKPPRSLAVLASSTGEPSTSAPPPPSFATEEEK
jgi:NhaP-type Na+/H+ or K+/H+ antiporter